MTKLLLTISLLVVFGTQSLYSQLYRRPATRYFNIVNHLGKKVEQFRIDDEIITYRADGTTLKGELDWVDSTYIVISGQQIIFEEIYQLKKLTSSETWKVLTIKSASVDSNDILSYSIEIVNPDEIISSNHLVIFRKDKTIKSFFLGDRITYRLENARQYYGTINRIEDNMMYFARGDSVLINQITSIRNKKPNIVAGVASIVTGTIALLITLTTESKQADKQSYAIYSVISGLVVAGGIVLVTTTWHKIGKNKSLQVVQY